VNLKSNCAKLLPKNFALLSIIESSSNTEDSPSPIKIVNKEDAKLPRQKLICKEH